jgi:hypothetical protein
MKGVCFLYQIMGQLTKPFRVKEKKIFIGKQLEVFRFLPSKAAFDIQVLLP